MRWFVAVVCGGLWLSVVVWGGMHWCVAVGGGVWYRFWLLWYVVVAGGGSLWWWYVVVEVVMNCYVHPTLLNQNLQLWQQSPNLQVDQLLELLL